MKRNDAGYTLLEMLVALAVFGLVLAGIGQAFRFGMTAWSGAKNKAASQDMAAVDMALTRMMTQTLPGTITGQPNGLSFTTRLPQGAGLVSALADAAVVVVPGGNLVLRYAQHPPGIRLGPLPARHTELLAPGIDQLAISYFAPRLTGGPAWSNHWKGGGVPLLIRIHCQLTNGSEWPDLVVAPANAGD